MPFKESGEGKTHYFGDGCEESHGKLYTEGQLEHYAIENVETERNRIHTILTRVLKEEPISQEKLDKVILGNRK